VARLADELLAEHFGKPWDERRAHWKRRGLGRQRRADENKARAGDDPRLAAGGRERFCDGAGLRSELVPEGDGCPVRAPAADDALVPSRRPEAPRNTRAFEGTVRGAEADRAGRGED
jgi:hypothetical protein